MPSSLFDPDILVSSSFVNEDYTSEIKTKEFLFPVESCNDFFETLQGKLIELEYAEGLDISGIFDDLSLCNTFLKKVNILGEYYSDKKNIKYYKQTPQILEITKIHERFHAVHHLTEDTSGHIWKNFSTTPPFYLELLAQLFTYIYIRDYKCALLPVFEKLNKNQPLIYQTFKLFKQYNSLQAEDLYWNIRNNVTANNLINALKRIEMNMFKTLQPQINYHLINVLTFICENPLIFNSESDVHELVMRELMNIDELNPKTLYKTNCTIGTSGKGISLERYKTMLMHKEYGHSTSAFSRSDIVILNPIDVSQIDDPKNLKLKPTKSWLTPDYIFEFGTEKSAGRISDFNKHFNNDFGKVAKAQIQGYLIHIHRNYYTSNGVLKKKNEKKIKDYSNAIAKILAQNKSKTIAGFPPKIIFVVIDLGGIGRIVRGKIRILIDPFTSKCKLKRINLNKISTELETLFK